MPPAIRGKKIYKLSAFENLEECVTFMKEECELSTDESLSFFEKQWEYWSSTQKVMLIDDAYQLIQQNNQPLALYVDKILQWADHYCTIDTWSNLLIEQRIEQNRLLQVIKSQESSAIEKPKLKASYSRA